MFPAIERRRTFDAGDLAYLANLCHNCGECLYACQYAPPHEFGIDVPRTLAELRVQSYEDCCWPRPLARAFRRQGALTALALAAGFTPLLLFALRRGSIGGADGTPVRTPSFYAVMPHGVMVGIFGLVGLFVLVAMVVALRRFGHAIAGPDAPRSAGGGHPCRQRRGHLAASARERLRLRLGRRGTHALAPLVASRHVRRVRAVLRLDVGRGDLSHRLRVGGPLFVRERARDPGHGRRHRAAGRPDRAVVARRGRDPSLGAAAQQGMDEALLLLLWLTSTDGASAAPPLRTTR